jgi:hypothetical protein
VDLQPLGEQVGCGFVACSLDDGENRAGGADDGFLGFAKRRTISLAPGQSSSSERLDSRVNSA